MIDPHAQRGEKSEASDSEGRPSRTQRTRAAAAVTRLGQDLGTPAPGDLDALDLPERLREEPEVWRGLKSLARGGPCGLIGRRYGPLGPYFSIGKVLAGRRDDLFFGYHHWCR